jgi:hypothetical protein
MARLVDMVCWGSLLLVMATRPARAAEDPAPGVILDLSGWRLTLPVDTSLPGSPDEISAADLETFIDTRFFHVDASGRGVVFRAPCGGATTKGSKYPRCELREMTADGRRRASWSTDDAEEHELAMNAAITRLPAVKPEVVCAQIHDATDDLLMVRLERRRLFVESSTLGDVTLDDDYELGRPFDVRIVAGRGRVGVWYDGTQAMDRRVSRDGCYFKCGCYTQSNVSKGDADDAAGEVVIRRVAWSWRAGSERE